MHRTLLVSTGLCFLTLGGCAPDYKLDGKEGDVGTTGSTSGDLEDGAYAEGDDGEDSEDEEEDFTEYETATLLILTPASGDFIPLGADAEFEAAVFGADGYAIPFDDIVWHSDVDMTWAKLGANFEDDSLDVGVHTLTATAELPNGDRLAYAVGGVLVQHENAGTYVGDMQVSVSVDFEGIPIGTSCIGAAMLVVDQYGESAIGESTCHLDLLGYMEFDLQHRFEYEIIDEEIDGDAIVAFDMIGFDMPFASVGQIDDGDLDADWGGSLLGYADFEGNLDVSRISRAVDLTD